MCLIEWGAGLALWVESRVWHSAFAPRLKPRLKPRLAKLRALRSVSDAPPSDRSNQKRIA